VAEKQHILDLTQVKDAPRYDSVKSTEGDLGTHPSSTNKDESGKPICDVMHPRLRARAKEWAEQFVLFDTAASYPMFIATVTKTRDSPFGPLQLIAAGCRADRIKKLGFSVGHIKALGKSVQEMRDAGWTALELKNEGYDACSLLAGGYSSSQLKEADFRASQMMNADDSLFNARIARESDYSPAELLDAGFDVRWLLSGGWSAKELSPYRHVAGLSISDMKASGIDVHTLLEAGYTVKQLQSGGFEVADVPDRGFFVARDCCIDLTDLIGCDAVPDNNDRSEQLFWRDGCLSFLHLLVLLFFAAPFVLIFNILGFVLKAFFGRPVFDMLYVPACFKYVCISDIVHFCGISFFLRDIHLGTHDSSDWFCAYYLDFCFLKNQLFCSFCYSAIWGVAEFVSRKLNDHDDDDYNGCIECCCCFWKCWSHIIGGAVALSLHIVIFPFVFIEGILRIACVLPFWLPCFFCFTLSRCLLCCNRNLHKSRWGIFFLVLYYPLLWMSLSFRWISKRILKSLSCFICCEWWDGGRWYGKFN
jgi:hypothetical protein